MTAPRSDTREPVRSWRLWFGVMAPPLAWTVAEAVGYALTSRRCDQWFMGLGAYAPGNARVATVISAVVMALFAAAALVIATRSLRAVQDSDPGGDRTERLRDGTTPVAHGPSIRWARSRFMALSGVLVSALLLFNIVLFMIPAILTDACREAV